MFHKAKVTTSDFAYGYPFLCSIVRLLSHSCSLLKPSDGHTCHSTVTVARSAL